MAQTDTQNPGGVRGDNGQALHVTVRVDGHLTAGIAVTITAADGSTAASGVTGHTGLYNTTLDAGDYTVTATAPSGTAASPVTIVESTDPALLSLTIPG